MESESRVSWLQWLIDFVELDISKLNHSAKYDLIQKVSWLCNSYFLNTSFDPFGRRDFSHNEMKEWKEITPEIQATMKQFIDEVTGTRGSYELPALTSWIRPEGSWPPSSQDHRVYFQIRSAPKKLTPMNWAILNVAKLIQGTEMHVIGKCKKCKKYFLNFSLRKKIYCSPSCASIDLAKTRKERWSGEKYDLYLKKQKKRMKEKYVEKRKAQGKKYRPRPKKMGSKRIPKLL